MNKIALLTITLMSLGLPCWGVEVDRIVDFTRILRQTYAQDDFAKMTLEKNCTESEILGAERQGKVAPPPKEKTSGQGL